MPEEKKSRSLHNIIIESRSRALLSGVSDVDSFDDKRVILFTDLGMLTISGESLHISRLNVDNGEMSVEGNINSICYSNEQNQKGVSFFTKLFR